MSAAAGEPAGGAVSVSFTLGADGQIRGRLRLSRAFMWLCRLATYASLAVLAVLLLSIVWNSLGRLRPDFLSTHYSMNPERCGILAGLWGTFWLVLLTALFSIPIGVGSAVYLEELAKDTWLMRVIRVNLSNLAGVPSIVYGILGLTAFRPLVIQLQTLFDGRHAVNVLGLFRLRLLKLDIYDGSVLIGAMTMSLVILPTVIIASQEALRAVPSTIRVASLALGATRWQTIWRQVLPASLPGIATGVILSISRAMGEAAPLMMIGVLTVASMCPGGIESPGQLLTEPGRVLSVPFDQFTAMPVEIYDWSKQPDPQDRFTAVAASGILVLLAVLLTVNAAAMIVRYRAGRQLRW
ncbi:MAG: phosphate ABC transporter permease PstA [Planctomycetaceae bacterium]